MSRRVELYLAIDLPRWLSQLDSLPQEERRAEENVLFGSGCRFLLGRF